MKGGFYAPQFFLTSLEIDSQHSFSSVSLIVSIEVPTHIKVKIGVLLQLETQSKTISGDFFLTQLN